MRKFIKRKNYYVVLLIDLLLFSIAFYAAFLMRFEINLSQAELINFKKMILPVLCIKMMVFHWSGLYRGMWRYVSLRDCFNIIKGSLLSTLLIVSYVLMVYRFKGISRSVFFNDFLVTVLLVLVFRVTVRFYFEVFTGGQSFSSVLRSLLPIYYKKENLANLLIVGAGDAGEIILREIRNNKRLKYRTIGFLDDHPTKRGKIIHGVKVLGTVDIIKEVVDDNDVDEVLIAIPSAGVKQIRRIIDLCKESRIKYKMIPGMGEIINGNLSFTSIRDVDYRDLLRRNPVELNKEEIGGYLRGKVVLVTGAGGSIGSELCRQICRFSPDSVILFERAESLLYEMDLELKKNFGHINIIPHLADIQYIDQIDKAFHRFKPEIIFHAAAYKHVPMMEMHPWKAVKNNIVGTLNVVEIAKKYRVERFVLVSTDKAVCPTNVMGTSKRIAEMIVQNQNADKSVVTKFMTVRFGNVIGSSGSVIPLFKKQISVGGPVTVTHPEVTRFFMTIPEACQLILQAGVMTKGGEIYILDMGESVNILSMAKDLIRFSGFEPGVDIDITFTGLRPGEKLFEELIIEGEEIVKTEHEKIMVLQSSVIDMVALKNDIDELVDYSKNQNAEGIKKRMKLIVPEYRPEKKYEIKLPAEPMPADNTNVVKLYK